MHATDFSEVRTFSAVKIKAADSFETLTKFSAVHTWGPCAYRTELHTQNYAFLGLTSVPGYADWGFRVYSTVPLGWACGTHGRGKKCIEDCGGETPRKDTTFETWRTWWGYWERSKKGKLAGGGGVEWVMSGFRRGVNEIFALLWYYTVWLGSYRAWIWVREMFSKMSQMYICVHAR